MKKLLSLLLALALTAGLSAAAFAETTTPDTGIDNGDYSFSLGLGDMGSSTSANPDRPGSTYYFTIFYDDDNDGTLTMLEDDDVAAHLAVSVKETGDKIVDAYSIVKQNGVYKVKVTTKETYTTEKYESDWTISLKKDSKYTVGSAKISIYQKWASLDAAEENHVDLAEVNGDNTDLYTDDVNQEAIYKLDDSLSYAEFYFSNAADVLWYAVKNSDDLSVNLYYDSEVNKTIAAANEDADLTFITFYGSPAFDYTGTLHMEVEEESYIYRVSGDKLYDAGAKYNETAQCWEISTSQLTSYVISDTKLTVSTEPEESESTGTSSDSDKTNPETGGVDYINLAVTLGVVSLAAAGAVALKK